MFSTKLEKLDEAYAIIRDEFDAMFADDEDYFEFENKNIKNSQAVQIQLMMRYQQFHRRVERSVGYIKIELDGEYAETLKRIKTTSPIEFSSTELKNMIEGHPDYTAVRRVYNRYYVLKQEAADMVKLIEHRHWVLKMLVETIINDGESWVV